MHDPLNQIERLAARARQEAPPPVNVTRQVIHRLETYPVRRDWTLPLLTAGSLVAAAIITVIGVSIFNALTDPLAPLFEIAANVSL